MMDVKTSSKIMERERQKAVNKYCADCQTISPQWISIKFGVFICLRCSGIHRSLGTHLTFVRSATLDALKSVVVEQFQTLNNEIMNEYYEANMPSHRKPSQSTDTKTVAAYVKDKYVKKLWINDDDEDPVELYQSGELQKRQKKKEKKEKKRKEKKEKKKKNKDKKEAKQADEPNLIDFQDGDDFGDFQEPNQQDNKQQDFLGDLIDGGNNDDDFGDFATPEQRNDDDFGDFTDPTASTGIDMGMFSTAPAAPSSDTAKSGNLLNNLSNLYNQSQPSYDPNNKYAALESLGGQAYPQQQQPQQQNSDMFFGMSMGNNGAGNSFNFPQQTQQQSQNAFDNSGFPNLTHQHSYPLTTNHFSAPQFPTQTYNSNMNGSNVATQGSSFNFSANSSSYNSNHNNLANGKQDLFGLKETLKKKNKLYKYNHGMGEPKNEGGDSAFSNLVATQWNS